MRTRFSFAFEELKEDLPRPPRAALRAMLSVGIMVSQKGWTALDVESRQALAVAGMHDQVNPALVAELLKTAGPANMKLVPKLLETHGLEMSPALVHALGRMRTITQQEWASLNALERYVLDSLAINTRLLWRAVAEIAKSPGSPLRREASQPWSGALARCEMMVRPEVLRQALQPSFQGGRAMLLARVAGVRAARRVSKILDLHAESMIGPAELDWRVTTNPGVVLWQGHVSDWQGAFFPAASLLAVTAAAVALYDMVKELDPLAIIGAAGLAEEAWKVGTLEDQDESTAVFVPDKG